MHAVNINQSLQSIDLIKTKSKPKLAIFADPLPVVSCQPNFAREVVSWISFLVLSFTMIGCKCGSCGEGRNYGLLVDLHIAYTAA